MSGPRRNKLDKLGVLICIPLLSLVMGCSEVVPLLHDSSQGSGVYSNLGTVKVNVFNDAKPEDEENGSLEFTPSISAFVLSTIKTKVVQSNLFTLSDNAVYELSGSINRFQSASVPSAARLIFGCLGLTTYFGGAILAIAKNDATYFYVGTALTVPLIGSSRFFISYYVASVGFEYTVKKSGHEIYRGTVSADSTAENPECSRMVLLDLLCDRCVNQMLKRISENVK